jgi:hypothetical protein
MAEYLDTRAYNPTDEAEEKSRFGKQQEGRTISNSKVNRIPKGALPQGL